MRIFITGSSGFIGQHVTPLLQGKHQLLCLSRSDRFNENTLIGNLNDVETYKEKLINFNPDVCMHLAWEGIPDFSDAMCEKNYNNSLSLMKILASHTDCKKVIVSGSCYEYGPAEGICNENDTPELKSPIAKYKTKLYDEAASLLQAAGINLIWFRIFYVYGQGQREESLMPKIIKNFLNDENPDIRSPFNANDFIHVSDVARAMDLAVNTEIESGIYNLGSGKSTQVVDIVEMIEQSILNKNEYSKQLKKIKQESNPINFWSDNLKVKSQLYWLPQISLEQGITECLKEAASL